MASIGWCMTSFRGSYAPASGMAFLQSLRHTRDVAFIGEQIRVDYQKRIIWGTAETVRYCRLAAMAWELGARPSRRRAPTLYGSRLSHTRIRKPYCVHLCNYGRRSSRRLVVIGPRASTAGEEGKLLHRLRQENRFSYIRRASDATIWKRLQYVRALVFRSLHEGFGLPPLEALYTGIPMIVRKGLPALSGLPSAGQISVGQHFYGCHCQSGSVAVGRRQRPAVGPGCDPGCALLARFCPGMRRLGSGDVTKEAADLPSRPDGETQNLSRASHRSAAQTWR
jgi:hypothetical protein